MKILSKYKKSIDRVMYAIKPDHIKLLNISPYEFQSGIFCQILQAMIMMMFGTPLRSISNWLTSLACIVLNVPLKMSDI